MKLSFLTGAAVGYVLGARAGRARYESITRIARAVAASPQVQSGAQLAQQEAGKLSVQVRHAVGRLLTHDAPRRGAQGMDAEIIEVTATLE